MNRHVWTTTLAVFALAVGACSDSSTEPPQASLAIDPPAPTVIAGETQTFTAVVENAGEATVTWEASGGVVSGSGLSIEWTAPMDPGVYTLQASVVGEGLQASVDVDVVAREGTVAIDFSDYRGSAATLPSGLFVTGEDASGTQIEDGFDPFTGVSDVNNGVEDPFVGFGAFTDGEGAYSFGIRERGDTDLRDSRLFLEYTNESDAPIVGFEVSYEVQVWFWGQRANRIRLKFNRDTGGYSDLPDLDSTDNPRGAAGEDDRGRVLDGTLSENRTQVQVSLDLTSTSVPDGDGNPIGALQPGETAYFRWQYSNASGDGGSLRSGLAIGNLTIVPIYGGS